MRPAGRTAGGTQVDGTVDVAVSYTVAGYFLPALLARFWRAFPGITVRAA